MARSRDGRDEERLLLQAVIEHAPYGLAYFPAEPEGEPFGNPAALRMLGRITRANDPDRAYDLKDSDGHRVPADAFPVARALREGVVINLEAIIERRDETSFQAQISAAPVQSSSFRIWFPATSS